jgi:putative ABC transport system ATP-binding protein
MTGGPRGTGADDGGRGGAGPHGPAEREETTLHQTDDRPPALELREVVKRYGAGPTEVRALTQVDLDVAAGEFLAVMGPSGSGKSTLLHLAGGLERPTAGRVLVDGVDLDTLDAAGLARLRRRQVGYVFQRLNLVPTLTAVENVMLPLELDGTSTREARRLAEDALRAVAIDGPLDRYPDDLSGGQQQRVAIARGIVGDRRLLLADEPTGSLDSVTADAVVELLAGLVADRGAALVLVTHEARFASWADRIVRVRDGRLTEETRPADIGDAVEAATR